MKPSHLSRKEERALFARYQRTHDPGLEARLVQSLLGLVGQMARAYAVEGIDPRDLAQEGALGLVQAVRRFDPSRGLRLSTYAAFWIRAYQYRHLLANHRLVRVGTTQAQRRIFFRIRALRARLLAAGLEPTAERMASLMGVSAQAVRELEPRMDARELSLDAPHHDGADEARLARLAASEEPCDERAAALQLEAIVRQEREVYRATLNARRRELFDARWLSEEPPTLQQLGERFGITRERVRQLERQMLAELGERVRARLSA
jgi:RNA polymerase sigma-32 factor